MAQVPNTTTFCLSNVTAVVGGTSLSQAFANANGAYFDPTYGGTCTCLLNFRNYTEVTTFNITTEFWYQGGGECMCGYVYLYCCTGAYANCYAYIESNYCICNEWSNVASGCYYVDFSNVCSYLAGSPIPTSFYWMDYYSYGYSCCTTCFGGGGNNFVTINVSDSM